MALHQSLLDLGEQAARCSTTATAKGVLAEATDLIRNALFHREQETALSAWYSRLLSDVVRSPALAPHTGEVRLTGSVALGDASPTATVRWLGSSPELEELLSAVGIKGEQAKDSLPHRVDSGLPVGIDGEKQLFRAALEQRPPAVQISNGLPDPTQAVDFKAFLLLPIQSLARWAAPSPRPTPDRLAIGLERELLTPEEFESLNQAWKTGLALDYRNWLDGVDVYSRELQVRDLAALDRTAYGAACWMVAGAFDSIKVRH
ncbi:hypothetical protein CPHO_08840 [Corynebacterium phocae]|uniref:DUF294 domain-containing protein n=1 Tax=Corynebacterium phocae TaxID=161895 RepID=A0A1L7D732_9CORY|nr:hypothetical protein [Corynebacterium phocae]APT93762.1 hypothetical protein CPHO_08840 [Corynebacterium phocae]KAA8723313.1 hypothetical protein F4V58_08345 [Corynebacterium phocae]